MAIVYIKRMILLMGIPLILPGCSILYDFTTAVGISVASNAVVQGSAADIETEELNTETLPIYRIANETYKRGDIRTAIGLYQRAFELEPDNPLAMMRIGEILNKHGEPLSAGQAYRQVLAIDPLNVEAKRGLGIAFLKRGQVDLAIEQFSDGLALEKNTKLLNVMGVAYDKKGERQTAQSYYRDGLELEPENLTLRSNLGLSLAYAGRHNESLPLLYALSKEPKATIQHRQILAMAYSLAGDYDAAEQTSRIDMEDVDVARRMRYFRSLTPTVETQTSVDVEPSLAETVKMVTIETIEEEPLTN